MFILRWYILRSEHVHKESGKSMQGEGSERGAEFSVFLGEDLAIKEKTNKKNFSCELLCTSKRKELMIDFEI